MKKNKIKLVFATLLVPTALGVANVINLQNEEINIAEAIGADSYWSTVDSSASANELFLKLSDLSSANGPSGDSGYGQLWAKYKTTDIVPGTNKIWDMYGGFQFEYQTKGGSSNYPEGASYNREHSVPKSWWDTVKDDRYCDVVHLVPTDCTVNSKRSNYAFGEVDVASYIWNFNAAYDGYGNLIQTKGASKVGSGKTINGISAPSTVFEPDDQYKGDFARIYYYFATRYGPDGKIPTLGDGAKMFSTSSFDFYMTSYGKALMNKWHVQDPVSQKELDRNDGIEATQGNRNPYVDHPEWADTIFGSNYTETHIQSDKPNLTIKASSTVMKVGESVTLTATKANVSGDVQWYVGDSTTNVVTLSSATGDSITVNGVGEGSKTIYAKVGSNLTKSIVITVSSTGSSQSTFTATCNKTFYVGDIITSSDLTVKNSLGSTISSFTFADAGYMFKYEDAPSGGSLGTKTFVDSVSYGGAKCSLTVNVQRKDRETISSSNCTDKFTVGNFAATSPSYTECTLSNTTSGSTYHAITSKNSANIQMNSKSNSGLVTTNSKGKVKSVKISVANGTNKVDVYGKDTPYSASSSLYDDKNKGSLVGTLTSTGTIEFETPYSYIGIRAGSGVIYLSSIEITYAGGDEFSDTAISLTNYLMIADTNGQCFDKFSTAKEIFEKLSAEERKTFMTSSDYCISKARERLIAWSKAMGVSIVPVSNDYVMAAAKIKSSNPITKCINKTTLFVGIGIALVLIIFVVLIKQRKITFK